MSLNKKAVLVQRFELDEILPYLADHKKTFICNNQLYIVYMGRATQRLFASSQICVNCGRVGTHFRLYHDPTQKIPKFINSMCLFSEDDTLMTADHIIPRSAGGLTHAVNLQVMCVKCNQKKADKMPPDEIANPIKEQMALIEEEWKVKYPKPLDQLAQLKQDIPPTNML